MFPDDLTPAPAPARVTWTCGNCGNDDQRTVRVDPSRPAVDERYAVGYCDSCEPARKGVRGLTRHTVPLVRSDRFDRARWQAQRDQAAEADLLRRFRAGHVLSDADHAKVAAIVRRLEGG